ncbi:DUF6099 family protein [Kitasatospora sp. NPDC057015]|uniref:DUF6099 family protein n=1 Tax=Kitasatospora sp. NPDC057015 TaxID=3346001 RepID=UPI00363D553E
MDALRLIKTTRHAMAEARNAPDALLEAWQAGLLTEAVASRIAERGGGELAALGQLLAEAGAQVASCLEPSSESAAALDWGGSGSGRASRLTDLGELDPLLEELGRLLHDATETLVVLACGADAESLYWTCIDGVDAGSECKDLIVELHRAVRAAEQAAHEPQAAHAPHAGPDGHEPQAGPPEPASAGPPFGAPFGASFEQGPADRRTGVCRPGSRSATAPRPCGGAPGGAGPDCVGSAPPACREGRAGGAVAGGSGRCAVVPALLPEPRLTSASTPASTPASASTSAPGSTAKAVPSGAAEEHLPGRGTPVLVIPLAAPSAARS